MTKTRIGNILKRYRALSWTARQLPGVNKSILSRWLDGIRPAHKVEALREPLEALAREVQRTKGACKGACVKKPDAPSVREHVGSLRKHTSTD